MSIAKPPTPLHSIRDLSTETNLYLGDCQNVLKNFSENTFDLIVTSPPYADQRKNTYGGIHPDKYVEWFLERSKQFKKVLKPSGSFVLNIKERINEGERHIYVLELILALRKQGWIWTEEYIWHKKNSHPGKWPNRFRDSWERCLHFTKEKKFHMYQDEVKVPMGDWAKSRLKNLGKNDVLRFDSQVGSGFGKNIQNWVGRDMAYPSNVLHFATECSNKEHPATFPEALPEWFIKLFTKPGDWVLDPFMGSGTTNMVARRLGRNSVGIDSLQEYVKLANNYLTAADNPKKLKVKDSNTRYGYNKEKVKNGNEHYSGTNNGIRQKEHSGFSSSSARKSGKIKAAKSIITQESISI